MTQNFNFSPAFSRQPDGDGRLLRPKAPTGHRSSSRTDRTSPVGVLMPPSPLGRPRTAHTRQPPLLVSPPMKAPQGKGESNSPTGTNRHAQIHLSPKLSFNPKNSVSDTLRLSPAAPEMLCINSSNNQSKESLTIDPAFISITGIPSDMQTVNMSNGSINNNQRVSFNNQTGSVDDIVLVKRPIPQGLRKQEICTLRVREDLTTRRSQQRPVTAERTMSHDKKRTAEAKSCYDELDEWIAAAYEHHQVMLRSNGYT